MITLLRPLSRMLCYTRSLQFMSKVNLPQVQRQLDSLIVWALENKYQGIVDSCDHRSPVAMHKIDLLLKEEVPLTGWQLFRSQANCFGENDDKRTS